MLCRSCNANNEDGNHFCDTCGSPLLAACPACGRRSRPGAQFCGGCGRRFGPPAEVEKNEAQSTGPAVPPALAALLNSRFAREGERKQVTVLFADIRGSTELIEQLDAEQAMQRLEPALEEMAKAVHHYGGTVNRVQGDGIMALFGAPLAYEDHAVRACLAARAMIDAIGRSENRVDIRVGLNSGEVVVRAIGHDLSMEYDAAGPTAHVASRMEQRATPGTALLTAATARLADGFIRVRPLGQVSVKGLSRPVEAFELIGAAGQSRWEVRAASRGLSGFVGRGTELRILKDALNRVRSGRGQIVCISGEAGLGKSRLVHEFLNGPGSGLPFLRAAAMPHGTNTPCLLVADMVRSWLKVDSADDQADIERKLGNAVRQHPAPQAIDLPALRAILDLPVRDAEWQSLDAARLRERMREAVRALVLQMAHSQPCLLVIEDLHWADPESRSVLDSLVARLGSARLLAVATYRPEYRSDWARHSYHALVQLAPLDDEASEAMLCSLLGDAPELAQLRRRIIAQADGTPLFLEEMARALVETGALVSEPSRLRLTQSAGEVEIPNSVQIVLASRIDRLPAKARTLLQIASVIGKDVPAALLRVVAGVPPDELAQQLLELQAREFLQESGDFTGAEYTFKHALTHAVAYDSMLLRHRRALHKQVLEAIEEHFTARIDEFTERLADHALRAQEWGKAAAYCHKAGRRAISQSAHQSAKAFFEQALSAVEALPTEPDVLRQGIDIRLGLRIALLAEGDLEQIRRHLQDAERLAHAIHDDSCRMPIVISRSIIANNLGDLDEAIRAGREGRELAERLGDASCFVTSGFALGQAYWNRGDFAEAERVLTGTVPAAVADLRTRHAGTTGTGSVLCLVSLSHTHSLTGQLRQAFARAREALEIAAETKRPYDLSYAHAAQGLAHLTTGDFGPATEHLEAALRLARDNDIRLLVPHAARYLGRAYAWTGRLEEAERLLVQAIEQTRAQSLVTLGGWSAASLGLVRLLAGAPGEAVGLLTEARQFAAARAYRPLEVYALRLSGLAESRRGADLKEAEALLTAASRLAQQLGMRPELGHCHNDMAEMLAQTGRGPEAASRLAEAARLYAACGMAPHRARAEAVLAKMRGAPGKVARSPAIQHH